MRRVAGHCASIAVGDLNGDIRGFVAGQPTNYRAIQRAITAPVDGTKL